MKPDIMYLSVKTDLHSAFQMFSKYMTAMWESQGLRTFDFSTFYKNTATKTGININAMVTIY